MNWEAIGAVGEVLGAVVVVATVFYLAVQLRQNSAAIQRTNDFALNDSIYQSQHFAHEVLSLLATDRELASIYTRHLNNERLTPEESTRFVWFANSVLLYIEQLWNQQQLDLGWKNQDAQALLQVTGPFIAKLLANETGLAWWNEQAIHIFEPAFRAKVDDVLAEHG